MKDPDVVYHLAALPRIQPSFDYPAITFEINALGTMNILEWARTKNCKVVYAGSSSHHNGIYENPYTFSKDIGEQLCEMYYRVYGVETRICRFYNVYGDSQLTEGEYAAVVGIFLEQYKHNKPLTITGDAWAPRNNWLSLTKPMPTPFSTVTTTKLLKARPAPNHNSARVKTLASLSMRTGVSK